MFGTAPPISIDKNVATITRNIGSYIITISVERVGAEHIEEGEVGRVLTENIPTLFIQRYSPGSK